jgi:hypothetical protein
VRRTHRKFPCERQKIEAVTLLKRLLAAPMLLGVMVPAKTDRPSVGGLQTHSAVGAASDVRAFDRETVTP